MDLWHLKREFLEHCEIEKGQSILTVENYGRYIDRFLTWLKNQNQNSNEAIDPKDITEEIIRKYRLYINRLRDSQGNELKLTTQNHHILAVRAFLRYLLSRGVRVLPPEKIALAKTGDRDISFLNEEEYRRFLDAPNIEKDEGLRDKAILEVLFSTGMRISELTGTNLGQINFEQGEISILGKGKKLRVVFLSEVALDWLIKYLRERNVFKLERTPDSPLVILDAKKSESLFLSSRNNRMNPRACERLVKKYGKIAGISKIITPHTLRHTFATDMLSAGADIRSVQSLLGHSNISTTQVYTHVTDKHLREIHQRFHSQGPKDQKM